MNRRNFMKSTFIGFSLLPSRILPEGMLNDPQKENLYSDAPRKRIRELGVKIGTLEPGPYNAITDVKGVRVGHTTITKGKGKGAVRTGVTVILPHNASSGKVEEGSVGIGLGLRALGWKGGIGTSSRILYLGHQQFRCGVLVASNSGNQRSLEKPETESNSIQNGDGSLIIVISVDIPLVPYQIKQITSSLVSSLPSVNILNNCLDSTSCVLFSTANSMNMEKEGPLIYEFELTDDSLLAEIILAGTEAIKEAIFNSLLRATPVEGRLGRKIETIPDNEFKKLLKEFGSEF